MMVHLKTMHIKMIELLRGKVRVPYCFERQLLILNQVIIFSLN